MGPQARHANLGQLLEALEHHVETDKRHRLRSFEALTEPSRVGDVDDVPFMQFDRFASRSVISPQPWRLQGRYRAYEAYWSPVTARGASPWRVALWALARLAKPDEIAKLSWRKATRLRIARLHRLRDQTPIPEDPVTARGLRYVQASLLSFIQRFRGAEGTRFQDANRNQPMDHMGFMGFAIRKLDAAWTGRILETVKAWNVARLPVETLAEDLSRHIRRATAAGALLLAAQLARAVLSGWTDTGAITGIIVLALVMVLVALGGGKFLAVTFSDVFIWNNNQDRDREFRRRQEILAKTQGLFEHVLRDEDCKRLVIVAHSLGTAITLETLSLMGRRNEAREAKGEILRLGKLSHLFTLGSPIDKIFYFFHTREAETYRAGRLNDDLRGDLSREPFFRAGRQRMRWLNIWDRIDIVSDPLFTPLGNRTDGAAILSAAIENHEVENTGGLDPVGSHVGYLANPNVVTSVAAALFNNETEAPRSLGSSRNWPGIEALLDVFGRLVGRLPPALIVAATLAAAGLTWIALIIAAVPLLVLVVEMKAKRLRLPGKSAPPIF
ncbi:MAG: hypothetical protein E6Q40_09535 [Cupriavidus sp.]|nr:MAG: hypothetical protein E6Q40_09535 [Cupriavidus sp.]